MNWSFRKADVIFIGLALAVIGGVALLPSPRDRNPLIPADAKHRSLQSEQPCVTCHQAAGQRPLPTKHPKRQDCFHCHARARDPI